MHFSFCSYPNDFNFPTMHADEMTTKNPVGLNRGAAI